MTETLEAIQADRQRMYQEHAFFNIFRTPVPVRLSMNVVNAKFAVAIDNQANRQVITGWVNEDQGEKISPAWFTKVLMEQPQLVRQLAWRSADVLDPAKRRQAEQNQEAADRAVFHEFCVANGFSEVEANYQLAKSVLGSFDRYTLAQAVQSNALQLAPASPAELEQFRQEAIEAENRRLMSLDIISLRKLTREAGARPAAPPQLDQVQRVRAAEHATTYLPLPDEFKDGEGPEEVLNAAFIRKCSKETLNLLLKRYGADQVNEALRTRLGGSYQY
jgi:hypothetical protein